jgi:hypothetical protein
VNVSGELQIGKSSIISNPGSGTKEGDKQQMNHEKASINYNFMNDEFNDPMIRASQIKPGNFSANDPGSLISLPADGKF